MKVPIASWKIFDWQGPATNVRFRITADDSFLARDDDNTGVEVDAHPKVFREVDCVVATETILGLPVKTITIPALWVFSTTDAIVNRTARYSAKFVTKSGGDIKPADMLQSFQVPRGILDIFNPVPWFEIIRANNPAAPVPIDRTTFSTEQIMELIGDGPVQIGNGNIANRIAFWSTPTTISGLTQFADTIFEGKDGDPVLRLVRGAGSDNLFLIEQFGAVGDSKAIDFGALLNLHAANDDFQWHLVYSNDASTHVWANNHFDDARLEFRTYRKSDDVLIGKVIFDEEGAVGISRVPISTDVGWFLRDSDGFHIGSAASSGGPGVSNRQVTFLPTNIGVGINKQTGITAQLDILSGLADRVALKVRTAQSPSVNIAEFLGHDSNIRFQFSNSAELLIGQLNAVRGQVSFFAPSNNEKTTIQSGDTPASSVILRLPTANPANGQLLSTSLFSGGVATLAWVNPTSGGDVSSDIGSTVDNRLARFQSTSGKLITDSAIVVADTTGAFTVPNDWAVTNAAALSMTLSATALTLQGLTGSSIAVNQFGTVFNAPAGSQTPFNIFHYIAGAQTQASGEVHNTLTGTTYNQTGTAGSDELVMVRTETALGSGQHNFIRGLGGVAGTTLRFRINNLGNYFFGATGGFIADENGNEYLKFTTVASAVNGVEIINAATGTGPTVASFGDNADINLNISGKGTGGAVIASNILSIQRSDNAALRINKTAATSRLFEILVSGNDSIAFSEAGVGDFFTGVFSTKVITFNQIPVGPNSTPTTDNQFARKKYVDDKAVFFSIPFKIDDPSTFPEDNLAVLPTIRVPDIVSGFLTKLHVIFRSGSHTSGGVLTFELRNNSASVATVNLDNTNGTAHTFYTTDFTDSAISNGNALTMEISTRTGTITERDVTVIVEGYQKLKSI